MDKNATKIVNQAIKRLQSELVATVKYIIADFQDEITKQSAPKKTKKK